MATIHVSEAEAARDFVGLLAQVRAGAEVVIEQDARPVALLQAAGLERLTTRERLQSIARDSPAVMDEDFARDVEEAHRRLNQPFTPPGWD